MTIFNESTASSDHGWLSGILMFVCFFNVSSKVHTCMYRDFPRLKIKHYNPQQWTLQWQNKSKKNFVKKNT